MNRPFTTVQNVPKSSWARTPSYLSRAHPGDLLLLGESGERRGGLLKIRRTGSFVSVSVQQAWDGVPIPWPRPEDGIDEIVIGPVNRIVSFNPRDPQESSEDVTSAPSSS